MRIQLITYFFLLFFNVQGVFSQEKATSFDAERIENLLQSEDFDQDLKNEEIPYYGFDPTENGKSKASSGNYSSSSPKLNVQISNFMYLIAALFLGLIVFAILRSTMGGSGKKLKQELLPNLGEADIQQLDTKALIAQAVAVGDFRVAIRLNFLDILKKLDEKKWINWRKNKTNQDYVRELKKSQYGKEFEKLTYHFDHSWYGDFPINEELYNQIEPGFQAFYKRIGGKV